MPIIDSQIHPYEANTPKRPWHGTPNWPPSATADENVAAMDKLGIDGAILISAFSIYRYDASYAVEAQKAYPDPWASSRRPRLRLARGTFQDVRARADAGSIALAPPRVRLRRAPRIHPAYDAGAVQGFKTGTRARA